MKEYVIKENNEIAEVITPDRPKPRYIIDNRKFEREELGLKYKTEDELTEEEKILLNTQLPSKAAFHKAVEELPKQDKK